MRCLKKKLLYYKMLSIYILIFIIIFIIIYINCFQKEKYKNPEIIHILTRTGTRENCFQRLQKSLHLQKFTHYKHLISNDNEHNTFLKDEKYVIPVQREPKKFFWECPYEKYLNTLCNVANGWIIFMDDDARFVDSKFLEKLSILCKKTSKEKVIIFRIYYGKDKKIRPRGTSLKITLDLFRHDSQKKNWIDMANICIHSSLLKQYPFTKFCSGDMILIKRLQRDGVPIIFDRKLPIGIWANSDGRAKGNDVLCL